MPKITLKKTVAKAKKDTLKFQIDCAQPVEDNVFVMEDFEDFLKKRIKVNGKKGNLGTAVSVTKDDKNITVTAEPPFSKRYIKYLTKKYLKKQELRDYLHVIATSKSTYTLRYFNISSEDAGDE
eukprot:CAMPEP_0176432918 /NCGR_PEP_ID=MMETSP0127-20121128/15684_1 /TAXON_ID=938130 /ORGANISM="Platyophrya macrostoma, Strain WH" /LENGTH=123 /DNA_ID=CAMNT_0017815189 /DNA_START=51 /DNA_END=422 /DNA_ORIENTATION=+